LVQTYVACWTEDDCIHSCGHHHESIADAMRRCVVPDGRFFIRACESGVTRSLSEAEVAYFLVALGSMPWRSPAWRNEKEAEAGLQSPPRFFHPRDSLRSRYRERFR